MLSTNKNKSYIKKKNKKKKNFIILDLSLVRFFTNQKKKREIPTLLIHNQTSTPKIDTVINCN